MDYIYKISREEYIIIKFKWNNKETTQTVDPRHHHDIKVFKSETFGNEQKVEWVIKFTRPIETLLSPSEHKYHSPSVQKSFYSSRALVLDLKNQTDYVLVRWNVETQHSSWKVLPPEFIYPGDSHQIQVCGDGQASGLHGRITFRIEETNNFFILLFDNPFLGKAHLQLKSQWSSVPFIGINSSYNAGGQMTGLVEFFSPPQLEKDLESAKGIFGLPLDIVLKKEGREDIPKIVHVVEKQIDLNYRNVEGLWRDTVNLKEVIEVQRALDDLGDEKDLLSYSIHSLCYVMKKFLRELSPKLISASYLNRYLEMESITGDSIQSFIDSLPHSIGETFKYVTGLLNLLHRANATMYPAEDLATIFCPVVFSQYTQLYDLPFAQIYKRYIEAIKVYDKKKYNKL